MRVVQEGQVDSLTRPTSCVEERKVSWLHPHPRL